MSRFVEPPPHSDEDFYVGYLSPAPAGTRRFVTRIVLALLLGAAALASGLSLLQSRFDAGTFDFGNVTEHVGTLEIDPVVRIVPQDGSQPQLLVGIGKHSASYEGVQPGQSVTVRGTTIESPAGRMIEVVDIVASESTPRGSSSAIDLAERVLDGEIVDSKCFLGVMKPGRGKLHRACASLCIRGGVPPALFVQEDEPRLYLLVESEGTLEPTDWLDVVGEPVSVRGRTFERGGQWFVETTRSAVVRR
ncbi:MAG: hypothetical protein AAGK22_24515 [Acidobacteriota bacterium]